jgi:prepilin-type N-terminal cleavage/methylation domain-containing protein
MKFFQRKKYNSRAFTLIELIIIIAIIGILAGIGIVFINPGKQLANTRNTKRKVDVNTILNAVYQYSIDNNGRFPSGIDSVASTSQVLGTSIANCHLTCLATTTISSCLDLRNDLISEYINEIPFDSISGSATNTDYYINKDENNRIIVGTCNSELDEKIEVRK